MTTLARTCRLTNLIAGGRFGVVFALSTRALEFLFYHLLLVAVDRVSRLPRGETRRCRKRCASTERTSR